MIRARHQKLKQISTGSVLKARLAYLYLRSRRLFNSKDLSTLFPKREKRIENSKLEATNYQLNITDYPDTETECQPAYKQH